MQVNIMNAIIYKYHSNWLHLIKSKQNLKLVTIFLEKFEEFPLLKLNDMVVHMQKLLLVFQQFQH
jgi:hypothetical protein